MAWLKKKMFAQKVKVLYDETCSKIEGPGKGLLFSLRAMLLEFDLYSDSRYLEDHAISFLVKLNANNMVMRKRPGLALHVSFLNAR